MEVFAKRQRDELEDNSSLSRKRVKMRDLQSILQSEAINEIDRKSKHGFPTHKPHDNLKTRDRLSSVKTAANLNDEDGLRKWKEMKQNGFMTPLSSGLTPPPALPKKRGRKSKAEMLSRRMEQVRKEQVDRFSKIAAPSGLLNGLNPGIVNHVRNSKQVHSIIQALVRFEEEESCEQCSESIDVVGLESRENRLSQCGSSLFSSQTNSCAEDDILAPKLASSNAVSESTSCVSVDESASVDTLSVNAGNVASQWLRLLQQDILGRLAALRRSKKRVSVAITTELPALLSKEFEYNHENDSTSVKDCGNRFSVKAAAEVHQARWSKLFNQMNATLAEDERRLECWLNEVTRMLRRCEEGLEHLQCFGAPENDFRSKTIDPQKEFLLTAAAASIYSTGNYVSSTENVSCC